MIKYINELKKEDLESKKNLLRVDFNVPIRSSGALEGQVLRIAEPAISVWKLLLPSYDHWTSRFTTLKVYILSILNFIREHLAKKTSSRRKQAVVSSIRHSRRIRERSDSGLLISF